MKHSLGQHAQYCEAQTICFWSVASKKVTHSELVLGTVFGTLCGMFEAVPGHWLCEAVHGSGSNDIDRRLGHAESFFEMKAPLLPV